MAFDEDSELIRYLLGNCSPGPELERLEERLFTEDRFFDRLLWLEDALIDAHIRGDLNARARGLFERSFLASARRRGKWEARREDVARFRPAARLRASWLPELGWLRRPFQPVGAVLFAACALLGFLGLTGVALNRTNRTVLDLRERLAAMERRPFAATATFFLAPGLVRSSGASPVVVPGADGVALQLALPAGQADATRFDISLSSAEGELLWKQNMLSRSTGSYVLVRLPGSLLTPGDYVLSLCEVAQGGPCRPLPSYTFRVPKES